MIDYHRIQKSKLYVVIHWFTCRAMMFRLRTIGHPISLTKKNIERFFIIYKKQTTFFFYLVFYLSFKLLIYPKFSNMFQ
jgi:hypothetical protein